MKCCRGFTLLELLVVIVTIGIMAAMLLPALSAARARGRSAVCMNHLRQVGLAMEMYVSDSHVYPPAIGGGPPLKTWADRLALYNPINWTNGAWNCPTFTSEGGVVVREPLVEGGGIVNLVSSSYAYNANGMRGYRYLDENHVAPWRRLGLGDFDMTVPENRVVAPSEMYEVGDTRPIHLNNWNHIRFNNSAFLGWPVEMNPWQALFPMMYEIEAKPPHAAGYNLLFVDGHVNLVKRRDYLYPPRTARNWNRDNQAHPEMWSPTSDWCVQN
ncbi:MAG: type II secretion system protein [Verrucomicrobiota bacterium]